MKVTKIFSSIIGFSAAFAMMSASVFAASGVDVATDKSPGKNSTGTCAYEKVEKPVYDADFVTVRRKLKVDEEEVFRVKAFVKNTGNTPWFSDESGCDGPTMYLGTDRERDRSSEFYAANLDDIDDTNWVGPNRVGMDQERIDPGHIASFTFWSKAPAEADILKEYWTPVLEGVQWLENGSFSYELVIGDLREPAQDTRNRLMYANKSGSAMDIPVDGVKKLIVDVSDQVVHAMLGDYVVRTLPVSTGAAATPTPYGTTKITLKQDVRVGHKPPHYIMPKFMWFRSGGYGFHALPSLGNDNGVFWTEALNHIQIPVSHGCVRLLPDDADWLFDYTPLGTEVTVRP